MTAYETPDWTVHFFEHQDDIFKLLIKMVGDMDIARDLVQDTYIKATQSRTSAEISNPRAYLFTIASNLARDFLRKKNTRNEVMTHTAFLEEIASNEVSFERQLYDRQRLEILQRAIHHLPPKCKRAFILRKIKGEDTAAIAEKMGISKNMVEKHLRKALKFTKEYLEKNTH